MSVAFWQADATSTAPASYVTSADEDVVLACDVTALLVSGGAASSPACTLWRIVNDGADELVALADAATAASNVISQRVRNLVAGVTYKLRWKFTTSGNVRTCDTIVICTE